MTAQAAVPTSGREPPRRDLEFLRDMTRDVVEASRVKPGSNGGGRWPLTNSCGFTLVTPGEDTYTAFWPRDFSMSVDSGFITAEELRNHLLLICRAQNGAAELKLANGLHVPPWAIPDHINYDGRPSYYPGTYSSGPDQGNGACGRVPPMDDHYEFVHLAYANWKVTRDVDYLGLPVNGVTVWERLERAFASPTTDPDTGLAQTTETDRAVGFGFCDAETHTGKLLFASLLRYRAAGELADLARALGHRERAASYAQIQKTIQANLTRTFSDPRSQDGWLRASTGLSGQPDVWGTLFALHLGVLDRPEAAAARKTVANAVRRGTIAFEGGVRHVPTDRDFSKTTAWERSLSAVNTYQNGAYWHTASGWLIAALWEEDRPLALQVFGDMIAHLRVQDFRKGPGHRAPWECYGPNGQARQNPVYMASVALPYGILRSLPATPGLSGAAPQRFDQDRFVVGMWVPPATNEELDERYREIAEANFTLVVGQSGTNIQEHLKRCERLGLKTLISANGPAETLPDGPACWGYLLVDEPGAGAFPDLAKRAEEIRTKHPGRFGYVNLYPNYAPLSALGTSSYDEHVAKFIHEVKPEVLSMDHYPLMRPGGDTRGAYCANLECFRQHALAAGIPFWNYFYSMPFNDRLDPTEAQIRWQIFTSVAYGAKGVLYFCYWTPGKGAAGAGEFPKGGAILTAEGLKTRHYEEARRINAELKRLGPTLMKLTSTGVYRVNTETNAAALEGGPVRRLTRVPGDPVGEFIIGAFRHADGRRAVVIVNHNYSYTAWPTVEFDAPPTEVREVSKESGEPAQAVDDSPELKGFQLSLGAGDARLFLLPPAR